MDIFIRCGGSLCLCSKCACTVWKFQVILTKGESYSWGTDTKSFKVELGFYNPCIK